ncbi:hypothetical protein [Pseudomonas sp. 2FG]|uniref:hypothetical protein n=1 Tax=Pseudomonas sp. 2FG TaxID=2502191 RepID=UPI0010F9A6C6|nr:hypothetical protein [Pseudomonas sp. 2FG]
MRRLALLSCCLLGGCLPLAAPLWAAAVVLSGAADRSALRALSRALGSELADDAELTRQLAAGEKIP